LFCLLFVLFMFGCFVGGLDCRIGAVHLWFVAGFSYFGLLYCSGLLVVVILVVLQFGCVLGWLVLLGCIVIVLVTCALL